MTVTLHENQKNCEYPVIEMVDAHQSRYQILKQFVQMNHCHQNGNVVMTNVVNNTRNTINNCKYCKRRNKLEINRICMNGYCMWHIQIFFLGKT